MKSMSWLLYENETIHQHQECRTCGFTTRSPSIYRRHSRHCVKSNSKVQNAHLNGVKTGLDLPEITSKSSTDFPDMSWETSDHSVDNDLRLSLEDADTNSKSSIDISVIGSQTSVGFTSDVTKLPVGFSNSESHYSSNFPDLYPLLCVGGEPLETVSADFDCARLTLRCDDHEYGKPECTTFPHEVLPLPTDCFPDSFLSASMPADTTPADTTPSPSCELLHPVNSDLHESNGKCSYVCDAVTKTSPVKTDCYLVSDLSQEKLQNEQVLDSEYESSLPVMEHDSECMSSLPVMEHDSEDGLHSVADATDLGIEDGLFEADCSFAGTTDEAAEAATSADIVRSDNCMAVDCKLEMVTDVPAAECHLPADELKEQSLVASVPANVGRTVSKKAGVRSRKKFSPTKCRQCKYCKLVLSSRADRRTHVQTQHRDQVPVYHCKDCSYSSVEHKNYERHLLRHLLAGPFRCELCSFSSTSQSSIKRHVTLQHVDESEPSAKKARHLEIPNLEVPGTYGNSVVENTVCETSDSIRSSVGDETSGDGAVPDSGLSQNSCLPPALDTQKLEDSTVKVEQCDRNADNVEKTEATGNSEPDVRSDGKKDAEPVVEVEVRNCAGEVDGEEVTWWTCLACGARYNERAKVRRHVKCKHRVALTECHVTDHRPRAPGTTTSTNGNDVTKKLKEVQSVGSTCEQVTTKSKSNISRTSSDMKLQPKTFVKIAPKPLQLGGGNCQVLPASVAFVNTTKRQVVLPKHNWKPLSVSLPPANSVPVSSSAGGSSSTGIESSSAAKPSGTGIPDPESELKRHLMENIADDKHMPSAVDLQEVACNHLVKEFCSPADVQEVSKSSSFTVVAGTRIVTRKKRRLILRPKNRTLSEPCNSMTSESYTALPKINLSVTAATALLSEHSYMIDIKESLSATEDGIEPMQKVSGRSVDVEAESHDEGRKGRDEEEEDKARQQLRISKQTAPLQCAHCQFTCFRLPDLRCHLLEHTGDKVYECRICSRSFKNRIGLYLHDQRKHKSGLPQQRSSPERNGETNVDNEQLSVEAGETDTNTDGEVLKKKKKRSTSVDKHQLNQKLSEGSAGCAAEKFLCTEGSSVSSNHQTVPEGQEVKIQKKELPGKKRFTETVEVVQSSDKSDHFKIVIRRRSSVGEEEILETIDGLNNKMVCKFCGYTAKIPAQLTQHMKIHTGERDYWCTIGDCSYGTVWRCDMKRHLNKFHSDEVEHHGGDLSDLLQRSYRPSNATAAGSSADNSSSATVTVLKLSRRQRRRLLKLQNREFSKLLVEGKTFKDETKEEIETAVTNAVTTAGSTTVGDVGQEVRPITVPEVKKPSLGTKVVERFRPYKCSECGRRSNWRWDLKKHIQVIHKNAAVIIKLTDDVARATFPEICQLSHRGRTGIRFPRPRHLLKASVSESNVAEKQPNDETLEENHQISEAGTAQCEKKPMSELEKTLVQAPAPIKSIGMIDMLRLKRFQCSGCPYRSNHRGDLGRHIRMRHGRGSCSINVLSSEVAAATLHAYRLQWNRKKAWLPQRDLLSCTKAGNVRHNSDQRRIHRPIDRDATDDDKVSEDAETAEKTVAENEVLNAVASQKQYYKDFMFVDSGDDATKCCDICPFKTDRTGLLELHKLRHKAPVASSSTSVVTFSCPHCPYFVRTSRQLEKHMALHEDTIQSQREPLLNVGGIQHLVSCGPSKNKYVCEKCPFVCKLRNEFWLHRRHHFYPRTEVPYSCDLCPFWASDRRTMTEHSNLHCQIYYPRLSVAVVGRHGRTNVVRIGEGSSDENYLSSVLDASEGTIDKNDWSDVVTLASCEHVLSADDVAAKSQKSVDDAEDAEISSCPQLDPVQLLDIPVTETELADCCPLLELECDHPPVELSDVGESVPCPTLVAESPIPVPSTSELGNVSDSVSGKVSRMDTEDMLNDVSCPAVLSVSSEPKPDAEVSSEQTPDSGMTGEDKSQMVEETSGCLVTENKSKVVDKTGECLDKDKVVEETGGCLDKDKVVEETGGCVYREECRCALQCPYCFFAIASVRLLRQHMVFHVPVSDACHTPVFQAQLDDVQDGRMDDLRCAELVQVCATCRQCAYVDHHTRSVSDSEDSSVAAARLENSGSSPESGDTDSGFVANVVSNSECSMSEFSDKNIFFSKLLLNVSQ